MITVTVNYCVVCYGHIAFFEQYRDAILFAAVFNGQVFNMWAFR